MQRTLASGMYCSGVIMEGVAAKPKLGAVHVVGIGHLLRTCAHVSMPGSLDVHGQAFMAAQYMVLHIKPESDSHRWHWRWGQTWLRCTPLRSPAAGGRSSRRCSRGCQRMRSSTRLRVPTAGRPVCAGQPNMFTSSSLRVPACMPVSMSDTVPQARVPACCAAGGTSIISRDGIAGCIWALRCSIAPTACGHGGESDSLESGHATFCKRRDDIIQQNYSHLH